MAAPTGNSNSVWGIKHERGKISWEFYFYDYGRLERERSVGRLLAIVRPWLPCDVAVSDRHPYFMFSIDFGKAQLIDGAPLSEIQIYVGNIGSLVSSGICYAVSKERTELKNFYFFFDAKKQMDDVVGKLLAPWREGADLVLGTRAHLYAEMGRVRGGSSRQTTMGIRR